MENKEIKQNIAKNITALRKNNKLTQAELAEKLNYSDKAISRWERGDTLPDIDVLCKICDIFGVTFEYLINTESEHKKNRQMDKFQLGNRITITLLAISLAWLIATCIYVYYDIFFETKTWTVFIWAVPVSALIAHVCNTLWGNKKIGLYILSILSWSLLASFYIQFLQYNLWLIFLIGVPIQVMIFLWAQLKPKNKEK